MHLLLLLLLLASASYVVQVEAADVIVGQVFFFDLTACPANFAALDGANLGRLFLGAYTGNGGAGNTRAVFTNSAPGSSHSHTGTTSMGVALTSINLNAGTDWLNWISKGDVYKAEGGNLGGGALGTVTAQNAIFPYIQLLACRVTQAVSMELPMGAVAINDPKTSVNDGNTACTGDFADVAETRGRFVVATGTAQPSPNFATWNPTPSYATSTVPELTSGAHTHTLSSTYSIPDRGCGSGSSGRGKSGQYTITGASSSTTPDLPLRAARYCKATTGLSVETAATPQLPEGALTFFAAASCPMLNWVPADSKYTGRLIVNLPSGGSNGVAFGNTNLLTTGAAGVAHTHSQWTSAKIYYSGNSNTRSDSGTGCVGKNDGGFSVGTGSVGVGTVSIPTVHMLLCRRTNPTPSPTRLPTVQPTKLPTLLPTKAPTVQPTKLPTAQPSPNPTTSFPSLEPTMRPTKLPTTGKPTTLPTKSPTVSRPTRSPTTPTSPAPTPLPSASPSLSPTSSVPTTSPTSSMPTRSPTNHPVEQNMCTAEDKALFVDYDNFFNYQASACAAECKASLIARVQYNINVCTANCRVFKPAYTPLCVKCFTNFLNCQSTNCNLCFVNGAPFAAQACKNCATANCRADLALCGGFADTMLNIPTNAPVDLAAQEQAKEAANQLSLIIGASVGGAALLLAAVLLIRRYSLNKQAKKEMDEVAARIFKNGGGALGAYDESASANPAYVKPAASSAAAAAEEVRIPLRTRYSFHGDEIDELDVAAGVTLLGISRNNDWWIAVDETTHRVGVIPASYVSEV